MKDFTRVQEWLSAGAFAHGISEEDALKIIEEALIAIQDGTLRCWDVNGMPIRSGVPLEKQRRVDPRITDEAGNGWLKANGYLWSWRHASEPSSKPPSVLKSPPIETWKTLAVRRAYEIIEEAHKRNLYPSQLAIGDQIAREFRKDGVHGNSDKPLTGEYIKRHALKGIHSGKPPRKSAATVQGK